MYMLKNVLKNLLSGAATRKYPFVKREPFPGYRGSVVIDGANCGLCGVCAKKCPSQCITIDQKKGTWDLDYLACIHCGMCVENCVRKCLTMDNQHCKPQFSHVHVTVEGTAKKKPKPAADAQPAPAGNTDQVS